ncbi:MAG: DUF4132 domain-containing protein [Polyangiaceae bacterium]|nr:DUF4132 domain-containing protein [Polyangiaceae bacterium]
MDPADRGAAKEEARRLLDRLLAEADQPEARRDSAIVNRAVDRILWDEGGARNPELLLVALACLERANPESLSQQHSAALRLVTNRIGSSMPPEPEVQVAVVEAADLLCIGYWSLVTERVIGCAEVLAKTPGLTLRAQRALGRLRNWFDRGRPTHEQLGWIKRLDDVLRVRDRAPLDERDAWAKTINADLMGMEPTRAALWAELMTLGKEADTPQPSKKWLAGAQSIVDELGRKEFLAQVVTWLDRVSLPQLPERDSYEPGPDQMQHPNAGALRGLVWASGLCEGASLATALSVLCLKCFRKIQDHGPYSERLGNACIFALGAMPDPEGLAQLARLRVQVKYSAGKRSVQRAYEAAAKRESVTVDEIADMSVPTCGLTDIGLLTASVGDSTAEIRILGVRNVELNWRGPAGKWLKTVPADTLRTDPEAVRKLKNARRDIQTHLLAQRSRLEALYLNPRWIPYANWLERYANQPLIGPLVRSLIWRVETDGATELGVFRDGRFAAPEGHLPPQVSPTTRVQLWHPLDTDPAVTEAWRQWLIDREATQPFKQAHREVYRLDAQPDDAGLYSSQFSGHLLREHLLAAVCRERGWRYALEPGCGPTLSLPAWNLSVEFEVGGTGVLRDVYETLMTGNVRFRATDDGGLLTRRVPAQVFSEVLRDADLLVSVASIAGDPAVLESGSEAEKAYWNLNAYAELCVAAADRAVILEKVLPRLIITKRCRIEGIYLRVTGRIREYRIHLGSGNVLMDPGAVHLPVALPLSSEWEGRLPFEGDAKLNAILSKAFLLANDSSIKDPTIRDILTNAAGS